MPFKTEAAPSLISAPTTEMIESQGGKISFMFSEIMNSTDIDITWEGAQIDPSKFQNQWVTSIFGFPIPAVTLESTYQGGLPQGVTVKYTLNKNNSGRIKSAAGQALPETTGTFVTPGTSTGGEDPCTPSSGTNQNSATISLMKAINYSQTSASDPVFDTANPAMVNSIVMSSTNSSIAKPTSAQLRKPDGSTVALTKLSFDFEIPDIPIPGIPIPSFPDNFFLSTTPSPDIEFPTFTSEAALNAAYPNGAYSMIVGLSTGGERTVALPLIPNPEPAAPKVQNYTELQNFNVSAPLTIRWNAFAGASQFDSIDLTVETKQGQVVFFAPNPCKSIVLNATDTQITIPSGTFQAATPYILSLSFMKTTHHGENTIQGYQEFSALSKTTRLSIGLPEEGEGTNSLHFTSVKLLQGNTVKITVEGTIASEATPGKVEGSTDMRSWQPVATIQKSVLEQGGGRTEIQDLLPAPAPRYKFYRFAP